MTQKTAAYRKRRKGTTMAIPERIRDWFSGKIQFTFLAHSLPHQRYIEEYWDMWHKDHPEAKKPDGLERLIRITRQYIAFEKSQKYGEK